MSELMLAGERSDDEWEQYIREADPSAAILLRAQRIYEFQQECKREHEKQGGSRFSEFMFGRFEMSKVTASHWATLGKESPKLCSIATQFSPDWSALYDFTRLPENQQTELLKSGKTIDRSAIKQLKNDARNSEIAAQRESIASGTVAMPDGVFEVISIDPPWPYDDGVEQSPYDASGHRASNPYPEMSLEDIAALEIPAADDCVLWLWTTHKFMRDAFPLLDAWGFEERAIVTWAKDRMGLGRWLRSQSEFCIMATRGSPTITLTNQTTILHGPMREHSRKPDEFFAMVDSLCVGRKLDYFSRETRQGWSQMGNDTGKFDE